MGDWLVHTAVSSFRDRIRFDISLFHLCPKLSHMPEKVNSGMCPDFSTQGFVKMLEYLQAARFPAAVLDDSAEQIERSSPRISVKVAT